MRVGDKVKYEGRSATIVGYPKDDKEWVLLKIPGYKGHDGGGNTILDDAGNIVKLDGIEDKYYVQPRHITVTESAIVGDGFDTISKELINKKINRI